MSQHQLLKALYFCVRHRVAGHSTLLCDVQMMNDLPDVAGSLFTNQYKAVKIEGKRLKPDALEGTGSVRNLALLLEAADATAAHTFCFHALHTFHTFLASCTLTI